MLCEGRKLDVCHIYMLCSIHCMLDSVRSGLRLSNIPLWSALGASKLTDLRFSEPLKSSSKTAVGPFQPTEHQGG